jgi:hypothetical protein
MEKDYLDYIAFRESPEYKELSKGPINFKILSKFSKSVQYQYLCPDIRAVLRLQEQDVPGYQDILPETFPRCSKAYKNGLWVSYRNGFVTVAEGTDTGDRGIPETILAQEAQPDLKSLHRCIHRTLKESVIAFKNRNFCTWMLKLELGFGLFSLRYSS